MRTDLRLALDSLVAAVAEDPPRNKSEFSTAPDVLAVMWRRQEDGIGEQISALLDADREEYQEYARLPDEHQGHPPELPEPRAHRLERWGEYLAPGDVAACAVLAASEVEV